VKDKKRSKNKDGQRKDQSHRLNFKSNLHDNDTFAEYAPYPPPEYTPYLSIYESEIMQMAGLTAHWDDKETGGTMFGLFSHAGRPIIMFVTGPGPAAIHEVGTFCPDIDFLMETVAFMKKQYGLQYAGNFHSHHYLQIKGLSGPDIKNTQSIGSKNGYRSLCQVVSTFENKPPESINPSRNQPDNKMSPDRANELKPEIKSYRHTNCIKLHPFIYTDAAAHSEPQRCSINVIPGTSPIREALYRNPMSFLTKFYGFPKSHIIFDEFKSEKEQKYGRIELPVGMEKQLDRLPENVCKNTKVSYMDGLIILSLPLPAEEENIFIAYKDTHPHKAISVYYAKIREPGTEINITQEALCMSQHTTLSKIYKKALRVLKSTNIKQKNETGGYDVGK